MPAAFISYGLLGFKLLVSVRLKMVPDSYQEV